MQPTSSRSASRSAPAPAISRYAAIGATAARAAIARRERAARLAARPDPFRSLDALTEILSRCAALDPDTPGVLMEMWLSDLITIADNLVVAATAWVDGQSPAITAADVTELVPVTGSISEALWCIADACESVDIAEHGQCKSGDADRRRVGHQRLLQRALVIRAALEQVCTRCKAEQRLVA